MKDLEANKKVARDAYQRISWVPKDESFRQMMAKMLGIDKIPDDAVGWCSIFWKEAIPDVELYIDDMAKWVAMELKLQNRLTEKNLMVCLRYALTMSLIHELVHLFGHVKNERAVQWITDNLIRDAWLGWHFIPCPLKDGQFVTWVECLGCDDATKHPSCPFRNIRIDAQPRIVRPFEYHVTELLTPLQSYWNRSGAKYARSWEDYYDMMFGKALGWYLESKYPEHCREIDLRWEHPDGYTITGHADLYLDDVGNLVELKFYYTTIHLQKSGKAQPDHIFQVQAYYTLGMKTKPWLFKNIKKITIVYYSKLRVRNRPRRVEFDVPLKELDLEIPARILYEAEKSKTAPLAHRCPQCKEWRSKYCKYFMCQHHPRGKGHKRQEGD